MSRRKEQSEIAITERELNAMTGELDLLHKETFPGVSKTLDEFSANLAHLRGNEGTARRSFLVGVGGVAVLGAVAACSSSGGNSPSTASAGGPTDYTGDLKVVALATALENLAVAAYGMALTAAGKGQYGKVPAAVGTFVTTAMQQHRDHAKAWNGVLANAGKKKVTTPALSITNEQVMMLKQAKSITDVAKLALNLENVAAETYLYAQANVSDSGGIMTAATIEPVETMHAAILNFVLGQYPVPVSFIGIKNALPPTTFTG